MKRVLFILLLVTSLNSCFGQAEAGKVVRQTVDKRTIDIFLPPGYDATAKYPVIYFNDGQAIFGEEVNGWHLHLVLDSLIATKVITPVIVVGVHSTEKRTSEYVPYQDNGVREDFGEYTPEAKQYTKFLISKIIPFVEKNYAVDKTRRGIMGFSFGGLQAIWAAIQYPEFFQMAAGFSPSFWVADFAIFQETKKLRPGQKIWFDMGTGEWNYYVPFLFDNPLLYGKNLFYYEVKDGLHKNESWRERAYNAFVVFAGNTEALPYHWDIQLEVISSAATPGRYYLRLNPVIQFQNKFTYSLSTVVKYELLNKEDGVVNRDGSFRFLNPKDLEVEVSYKGESKKITISYQEVEILKRKE